MPLISCPDCGRLHSSAALHCPQCGRPADGGTGRGSSPSIRRLTLFLLLAGSTSGVLWQGMAKQGFWIPGLLFGVSFSLSARFRPHLLLSFSSVSGIIYLIAYFAGQSIAAFLGEMQVIPKGGAFVSWGLISGAIGAFLVLQAMALFHDVRIPIPGWSVTLAGSIIGLIFVEAVGRVSGFGKDTLEDWIVPVLGFAVWQATVGVLSYKVAVRPTNKRASGAFSLRLQQMLTGPAVQFLGLVATLLTFVQMLWGSE